MQQGAEWTLDKFIMEITAVVQEEEEKGDKDEEAIETDEAPSGKGEEEGEEEEQDRKNNSPLRNTLKDMMKTHHKSLSTRMACSRRSSVVF